MTKKGVTIYLNNDQLATVDGSAFKYRTSFFEAAVDAQRKIDAGDVVHLSLDAETKSALAIVMAETDQSVNAAISRLIHNERRVIEEGGGQRAMVKLLVGLVGILVCRVDLDDAEKVLLEKAEKVTKNHALSTSGT